MWMLSYVVRRSSTSPWVRGRGVGWSWIVRAGLWELAKPLVPPPRVRPQGGGTPDTLLAAIT